MRRFITLALLAISTSVFADDYLYLTIGYNSTEQSIELATIQKITFENNQMVVTTSEGNVTFPQSEMEKMFFSSTATAIETIDDAQPPVANNQWPMYDLSGRKVSGQLPKGIYIVRQGNKIVKVSK